MTSKEKKIFREMKDKAVSDYMLFRDDDDFDVVINKNGLLDIALVYMKLEKALEIEY